MSSPEALLISSILRDGDYPVAVANGIHPNMIHAFPDEWAWVSGYFIKYKKTPSKVAFKGQFPEFVIKAANDTAHFATETRRSHARYELTSILRESTKKLSEDDLDEALKILSSQLMSVVQYTGSMNDTDIVSSYEDIAAEVQRRHDRVEEFGTAGIATGFPSLDEATGGPQPGEVWIVGARLGEMKSWTLQRMAAKAAADGRTVQFDALEQSRPQVAMRIHSFLSADLGREQFNNIHLMQGKGFNLPAYMKFLKALKDDVRGRLHVSDTSRGRVTPMTIASQIERNKAEIVFVDYLQLMGKGRDWQEIAALSGELHQVAQEYQVPIIAASQLNRSQGAGKGEPAGADALSNADAIGHDADMIINQRQLSQSVLLHKCVKNRNGVGGFKWYSHANPGAGILKEISYNRAMDLKDEDADRADAASQAVPKSSIGTVGGKKIVRPRIVVSENPSGILKPAPKKMVLVKQPAA